VGLVVENVLLGGSLAFAAAIQPGPLQAFLVSRVLASGWRHTLPACFAPLVSDGPIAALAIVAVGQIPPTAQHVLRAGGGLLLVYLAAGAFRAWREPSSSPRSSAPRTVLEAVLVNLLNPNPYLGWTLVMGPAVVAAWRQHPGHALGFVVSFYVTMLSTLAAFVLLVGTSRQLDPARRRALTGLSALLLAVLGLALLAVGARELWGVPS
jgi:threonine/homoserine/homoserine lactone efflux protein